MLRRSRCVQTFFKNIGDGHRVTDYCPIKRNYTHLVSKFGHNTNDPQISMEVCCCSIGPQPYPVIYVVANPVSDLLDRKKNQRDIYKSSNESKYIYITKQNRNDKKKGTTTKYTSQKKIEEGHSIERVWYNASREPSDTLPGSQPCTQTRSVYHTPYSQGFSLL